MWDEYQREYFTLRAMIFVTIHEYPGLRTVSGQTKGKQGCVVCCDGTAYMYLPHSRKLVYMRHRRFLSQDHKYRRIKNRFTTTVEEDIAPERCTGKLMFEMVKNINVVLGKGKIMGKKRKKTKVSREVAFKKQSIFFKYLPYWKDLEICHSIDLMHVTKNIFD